jgi:large subunit ribosomal protein L21
MEYAIVDFGGSQQRVQPGDTILVDRLSGDGVAKGKTFTIDRVLLVRTDKTVKVGSPHIAGASVKATVLGEEKGKKVLVFKKKRRKGYRRTNGYRAQLTAMKIDKIQVGK